MYGMVRPVGLGERERPIGCRAVCGGLDRKKTDQKGVQGVVLGGGDIRKSQQRDGEAMNTTALSAFSVMDMHAVHHMQRYRPVIVGLSRSTCIK